MSRGHFTVDRGSQARRIRPMLAKVFHDSDTQERALNASQTEEQNGVEQNASASELKHDPDQIHRCRNIKRRQGTVRKEDTYRLLEGRFRKDVYSRSENVTLLRSLQLIWQSKISPNI